MRSKRCSGSISQGRGEAGACEPARGPIRLADGADNIGTALLLELPDRAAADKFWNEEPFAKTAGIGGMRALCGGCGGSEGM